ncbi:MAG: flap endonuclease [Nitriliruptorales bacterium]|nr:flap endonuclease [Nitriliruptorales bacterium]
MAHRLLLDTSSLTYRAFFALPTSIKAPDGRPINAVHGYLDMTAQLVRDLKPDEVVHVFDHDWRPMPRVRAYAGYKSQRAPDPEELPEQFDVLREVLGALGMPVAEAPGWEADDAIATMCARASADDLVDVVTGDRDMFQVVCVGPPQVRVLFTVKGVSQLATFDEDAVVAKYGIPPDRYAEFAALRGDPSDGLPGVKGVGEKTARTLIQAYDSIPALLDDLGAQTPRLRAALDDARGYLAAMGDVVPVRTSVEVTVDRSTRDDEALDALGEQHRLSGPLRRLREALDA